MNSLLCILLYIFSLLSLHNVIRALRRRWYAPYCWLDAAACLLSYGSASWLCHRIWAGQPGSLLYLLPCLLCGAYGLWRRRALQKEQEIKVSPLTVKEALDALPIGIAVTDENGQVRLINEEMRTLALSLCGDHPLNGIDLMQQLRQRSRILPDSSLLLEKEGKDLRVELSRLEDDGADLIEITAVDVTDVNERNRRLEEDNQRLKEMNERQATANELIEELTRKQELLDAKRAVHDDLGRTILALKHCLEDPEADRSYALSQWRSILAAFRGHSPIMFQEEGTALDALIEAGKRLGVEVSIHGSLPNDPRRAVLMQALHECITNTVKHAHGDRLNVEISEEEPLTAVYTNNGDPPRGEIVERGGLLSLRNKTEAFGGTMEIASSPAFILKITLPAKQEES